MGKGSVNERHLRDCYEAAGYRVYRPATVRFGENDMWGLFDLACLKPEGTVWSETMGNGPRDPQPDPEPAHMQLVQCKTNRASGITEWFEKARPFTRVRGVTVAYAVRHDREGWRIAYPDETAQRGYTWLYDGRDSDACIGDGLTQYLKGETE